MKIPSKGSPKISMLIEDLKIAKLFLNKNKEERCTPPDIKTYYKVIVNNIVWYQYKDRQNNGMN